MATRQDLFPKKYFTAAALKGKPVTVAIAEQTYEKITDPKLGEVVEKPVLAFENTPTRLILNVTNFDLICEIVGPDSDDWPGHEIELYATQTNMAGRTVDCVRVRAPAAKKPKKAKVAPAPEPEEDEAGDDAAGFGQDADTVQAAGDKRGDLDDDIPF